MNAELRSSAFCGRLSLDLSVVTLARTVSENSEQNHDEQRDEDDDDPDLDDREQETNQQDQFFQQRDHDEDQSDYRGNSAKAFNDAATHKLKPRKKSTRISVRMEAE